VLHENTKTLDLSFLKEFCRSDNKKMARYIHTFLESASEELPLLRDASANQQWMEVKSIAHRLKPQVMFIGLPAMQFFIEKIETEVMGANPEKNIPSLVGELEHAMEEATDSLIQTLVTFS